MVHGVGGQGGGRGRVVAACRCGVAAARGTAAVAAVAAGGGALKVGGFKEVGCFCCFVITVGN